MTATMVGGAGWCQTGPEPETESDSQDLSLLFARLDEAEQSYRFAQLALAAGDIRSAISSLERVLQFNPELSNIKYELGLLYLEVGQSELARIYLEQALSDPSMPAEQRRLAEQALVRVDSDRRRTRFSGVLSGGLRWDENPNAATESIFIVGFNGEPLEVTRDSGLAGDDRSDDAFEASAAIQFGLVFAEQMGHELVLDARWDSTEYSKAEDLDTSIAQVRIGPRINIGNASRPSGAFNPYLSTTSVHFGEENLFTSWALGSAFEYAVSPRLNLRLNGQYEERDYNSFGAASNAQVRDGSFVSGAVDAAWRAGLRTQLRAGFGGGRYDADADCIPSQNVDGLSPQDCESFDTWNVNASVQRQFRFTPERSLRLSASARFGSSRYDEGDPFIDPSTAREDERLDLTLSGQTPLNSRASVYVDVGYSDTNSNLPNFEFDNTFARAGLTLNF